jgi:copper chaperone CopZ
MRHHLFPAAAVLVVAVTSATAAAHDPPAKPERFTCRVLGLFAPDREKDLREAFTQIPEVTLVGIDFEDAEVTVEFVPAKAFPGAKPDEVIRRLDDRLRSLTRGTFSVRPRRSVPRDRLERVVIPVVGLDCKGCCLATYEAISGIDGVEQATVSLKEGRVSALIDPSKTDRVKLEDALRKRGVQVGKP